MVKRYRYFGFLDPPSPWAGIEEWRAFRDGQRAGTEVAEWASAMVDAMERDPGRWPTEIENALVLAPPDAEP
ncbi:hypothetical protein [Oceanibacterium hippocampi]|uniref:Uncharacterized protein n=1 Tax=Oceanibacterium hippocampi TaxID=745714 RepID=A0A1Y5U0Z6_9PROT|nr:hypothetical protein [Oceanibacterium hippocampi]SLN77635.1 hypothetical protein OCH7691_04489 [Oceanibacterium hippocampi]